jgi:predicted ATPase
MKPTATIIDGRYRIAGPIGEGGMSIVFQATDEITGLNVALKLMKERVTSSHIEDIIRFKREIEIVTQFNHPNLIKIYGSGEFESKPYLVMELFPPPPCKINERIPAVLEAMVLKLLQKDPDLRYQSARGLWADLSRFENGERQFAIGFKDPKIKLTYQTRLIGRDPELKSIQELIKQAKSDHGGICLIKGEAGIGKSRLLEEVRSLIYENGHRFIGGRCLNHPNKTPYQPFKDALDDYLGKLEKEENEVKSAEIHRLKQGWTDLGEIVVQLNPRLKKYIATPKVLPPLETERENQRFLMVLTDFFCDLSSPEKICVLILEDLQWADESSLHLLRELLRKIHNSRLLILGTYRDNEIHPEHGLNQLIRESAGIGSSLAVIKLEPFNDQHLNKLIACVLGETEEKFRNLTRYIFDKSGGNPFLAMNIIKELIENKAIIWKAGCWEEDWKILSRMPVPGTMFNVILRQIEHLTPEENDLLCKGAVIDREFEIDLLYQITNLSPVKVVTLIDEFIAKQLLERSLTKGKVLFVHDRIRDVFYHKLPDTQKRKIHLQIAAAIERNSNHWDDMIFDLAHHYAAGGDQEKTLQFMLPAAEKARKSYANEAAAKYYKEVINILKHKKLRDSQWFQANENLVEVYLTVGKNDDAIAIAEQLLPLATNALTKARIYKKMGTAFLKKGDWIKCEDSLAQSLELLASRAAFEDGKYF